MYRSVMISQAKELTTTYYDQPTYLDNVQVPTALLDSPLMSILLEHYI